MKRRAKAWENMFHLPLRNSRDAEGRGSQLFDELYTVVPSGMKVDRLAIPEESRS